MDVRQLDQSCDHYLYMSYTSVYISTIIPTTFYAVKFIESGEVI